MPTQADVSRIEQDESTRRNHARHNKTVTSRWWLEDEAHLFEAAWSVADHMRENQRGRRLQNFNYEMMYNHVDLLALNGASWMGAGERSFRPGDITLNVIQNAIDTAASMIAKNRPKPLFLTDGGDWKTLQKAIKLTRFVAGVFEDSKLDALNERVFTDAGVFGTGAIKFWADHDQKRIRAERVLLNEILVDDLEGIRERPSQMHQLKEVNRDALCARFPELEAEIRSEHITEDRVGRSTADVVLVLESWHIRSGPKASDGLHTISIRNCTLLSEEYEKDYYPILFWRWYPSTHGFWGRGICQQLDRIQREINRLLQTIQMAQNLIGVPVWMASRNARVTWDNLMMNEIGRAVEYSGDPSFAPQCVTPPPLHEQIYSHLWQLVSNAYNIIGINQSMSQGQKQPGLESGAAIREATDIASGRFQVVGQRWEGFHIEEANVIVDLARDLYDAGEDIEVHVKDDMGEGLTPIKWSEVSDTDHFKIHCFPVSGLPSTPQGRLQTIMEWVAQGWIPKEQAMALLEFPDLKRYRDLETGTIDNVQATIAKIKDAGKFDVAWAPIPQMNIGLAVNVAARECVVARNQGVDDETLTAIQQYITLLDEEGKRQAPPPPPPAPGGPPGAPPGPPGPPGAGPPPSAFQKLAA